MMHGGAPRVRRRVNSGEEPNKRRDKSNIQRDEIKKTVAMSVVSTAASTFVERLIK